MRAYSVTSILQRALSSLVRQARVVPVLHVGRHSSGHKAWHEHHTVSLTTYVTRALLVH